MKVAGATVENLQYNATRAGHKLENRRKLA